MPPHRLVVIRSGPVIMFATGAMLPHRLVVTRSGPVAMFATVRQVYLKRSYVNLGVQYEERRVFCVRERNTLCQEGDVTSTYAASKTRTNSSLTAVANYGISFCTGQFVT